MQKKVIITGGGGFVGSKVCEEFAKNNYRVTIYDKFIQYFTPNPHQETFDISNRLRGIIDDINIVRGDTSDRDFLRRTINDIRPDIVVHMAALPLANIAIEYTEEANASILQSTMNLMEIISDADWECRLVYISSSMVYGDFETNTVDEISATNPKEIYGSLKLCGEIMVNAYHKIKELDSVIIRPSAVYGPYDANGRVVQKFINCAKNNSPVEIIGDGSNTMDFTFRNDVARGIYLASITPGIGGETFNITYGQARSLTDLVECVKKHYPEMECIYTPKPKHVPTRGTLSVEKAKKMLGYAPQYDLETGVSEYVKHLEVNSY